MLAELLTLAGSGEPFGSGYVVRVLNTSLYLLARPLRGTADGTTGSVRFFTSEHSSKRLSTSHKIVAIDQSKQRLHYTE